TEEIKRRLTKSERHKRHIERLKAENAELRAQQAQPSEQHQDAAPSDAAAEQQDAQGEPQETREQFAERVAQEVEQEFTRREHAAVFRNNEARFAGIIDQNFGPGFYQQTIVTHATKLRKKVLSHLASWS